MPQRSVSPIASALTLIVATCGSASAETSYGDFYRMNDDQQWQVMEDAVRSHSEAPRGTNPEKSRCLTELFTNIMHTGGTSEEPLGFRTAFSVMNFERDRSVSYGHDQSVEDVIDRVVELYCPEPS